MLGKGIVTFLRRFMMRKTGFDVFGQKSSEPRGVDVCYGQWRRVEGGTYALTDQRRTPRKYSLPLGGSIEEKRTVGSCTEIRGRGRRVLRCSGDEAAPRPMGGAETEKSAIAMYRPFFPVSCIHICITFMVVSQS